MEQHLKQRLIGAVVLVSLAVIFIPLVLEGPDEDWAPRTHDIPRAPELDYRAGMDLPLPEADTTAENDVPAVTDTGSTSAPVTAARPAETPAPSAKPPAPPVEKVPVAAAPTVVAKTVPVPAPGWYAQLGSFSQQRNAETLRDRLKQVGSVVLIQQVDTGKSTSYRVLAGPARDRAGAEALLRKLGSKVNTTGIVIEIGATEN